MERTTPKTNWVTGELVTAEEMNAIGENLAVLLDRPIWSYKTPADIEVSTYPFVDIDSENLSCALTTTGGDVLIHFQGLVSRIGNSGNVRATFDVKVDDAKQGGDDGITSVYTGSIEPVSFTYLIENLTAGSHTFLFQWTGKNGRVGLKLRAGAQFWVREI